MNVVLGQALRWWVKPVAQLDDVVRVIDAGERLLLAVAAGSNAVAVLAYIG